MYIHFDQIKSYQFEYETKTNQTTSQPDNLLLRNYPIPGTDIGGVDQFLNAEHKRMFLTRVKEYAKNDCIALPAHEFKYNELALPSKSDLQQDHWGYFNANGASSMEPKIYVYPNLTARQKYSYFEIPNQTALVTLGTADRSVNRVAIKAGILEEVIHPTGGSTRFVYEPNTFYDAATDLEIQGGGLRVKQTIASVEARKSDGSFDYIETSYDYKADHGKSSGVLIQKPEYVRLDLEKNFTNGETEAQRYQEAVTIYEKSLAALVDYEGISVSYTQVKAFQKGNGFTTYNYHAPRNYLEDFDVVDYRLTNNANNSTNLLIGQGKHIYPYLPLGDHYIDEADGENADLIPYGKLERMRTFREDGKILSSEEYTYQTINTPQPVQATVMINDVGQRIVWGTYKHLTGASLVIDQVISKVYEQVGNDFYTTTTNSTYTTGDLVFVRASEKINPDGSRSKIENRYELDYNLTGADQNDPMVQAIQALRARNQVSPVIEQVSYLRKADWSADRLVDASLTLWNVGQVSGRTNVVRPERSLDLEIASAQTIPFTWAGFNANGQFAYDANYKLVNQYNDYDHVDNLLSITGQNGITYAQKWGYNREIPVAEAAATESTQFGYFGVENRINSAFDNNGWQTVTSNEYSDDAYMGQTSRKVKQGAATGTQTGPWRFFEAQEGTEKYTFSAWVKTDAGFGANQGKLELHLFDLESTNILPGYSVSTSFGESATTWQYVEVEVDMAVARQQLGVSASAEVQILCNSKNLDAQHDFLIDELRFRPSHVLMSTQSYLIGYGPDASLGANQKPNFTEYDDFGRPVITRNFKNDITSRRTYQVGEALQADPDFTYQAIGAQIDFETNEYCNVGTGYHYEWNFGDGQTSTITNPNISHTYTQSGIYTVTVSVKADGSNDLLGQSERTIQVVAPQARPSTPIVDYTIGVCNQVNFETVVPGAVDHYTWEFGDGTQQTTNGATVSHTYATITNQATFKVVLTAYEAGGGIVHQFDTLTIAWRQMVIDVDNQGAHQYQLTAAPTDCVNAAQFDWNFGDGTTLTTTTPVATHTYSQEGLYPVTLTVKDATGQILIDQVTQYLLDSTSPLNP